ncbi:MAG TPA: xanthine dehydrogenase small subunit, partial [Rubrivivax sp.]|nr:xanthine dehydrogenase small subunit [Rubrivivax sp.]
LDQAGQLRLKPVNACIQFVPTLHGKALFAVEDLAGPGGRLHPVQQAMVDQHGSQCGFCTPGFVMSLWACYQRHQAAGTVPTRQQLADDLSGNLCRCTGYRPILDAGQHMFSLQPAAMLDVAPVVAALRAVQSAPSLSIDGEFHAPRTLAELAALRQARPQARLLAGSTDVGLWITKQFRSLGEIIYTGDVAEMQRVEISDALIQIGAAAPLEHAWQALVGEWPELRDLWLRFASLPIREVGTMGGNVANGSPIGDSAPVLMALGAGLVLRQGDRVRQLALDDFYTGYMQNRLESGEFLQAIVVPRRKPAQQLRAYKISKRFDSDISALCGAFAIELDGDAIRSARVAFGGMAATVKRAARCEAALQGQPWNEATLQAAMAALQDDFKPLSDMRASSRYRMQVAQNLLRRFWLETRPGDPLPEAAVNVWSREERA